MSPTGDRRAQQRAHLIDCAEAAVEAHGLLGLRARDLAASVGCSVGAIYNLVADLDELALRVAERTLADLNARLDAAGRQAGEPQARVVSWALAYCDYAAEHPNRWRALFDHRLPPGRDLPDWFVSMQLRLFARLEDELASAFPNMSESVRHLRARTLFSAVHGIVILGLEEKLVAMPVSAVKGELAAFLDRFWAGSATYDG